MYDSAKKDLVWRGVASKTIDPKAKPEKQKEHYESGGKTSEELPNEEEIVTSGVWHEDAVD